MALSLRTVTLGCKVNQYETEFVRQGLVGAGYVDADDDEPADVCLVNTCTVTHEGDAKSRQVIRRLAKRNPTARIVVMGCYATRAPDEVAKLPGVAEVVTDKRELPDLLGRMGVVDVPDGISDFAGLHRAFVKVQDGCMLRCSFCIIPHVRPNLASRPPDAIVSEVRRLIAKGFREVVLTGVHLGHYGVDFNHGRPKSEWVRLSHLLERLMRIDEDFRVRLSSIEATEVTRELIDLMAMHPRRICPHLHVSMQSGSDDVLARMRRRWGRRRFVDRCKLVQERLDRPAMTTDVIVGFPGETEDDFQQTCDVCDEIGFSKIHIFPFSPRRGTPAADMPGQIAPTVKSCRIERLKSLADGLQAQFFDRLVGTPLRILVQSHWPGRSGIMSGTACRYAPVTVVVPSNREGNLVDGIATARHGDHLLVSPLR